MPKIDQWKNIFCSGISPLELLEVRNSVTISVKRDDLNHPVIQGNKLRKLKYNFKHLFDSNISAIATFGGAWSNHIAAIARAAKLSNIKCFAFIRGNELENNPDKWSATLIQAQNDGARLIFQNRSEYRKKHISESFIKTIPPGTFVIPEGGSNRYALKGVAEIIDELIQQNCIPDYIVTACGTGGTVAGLMDGVYKNGLNTKIIGIPVLKGARFLEQDIKDLVINHDMVSWNLYYQYHAGGYAKSNNADMVDFAKKFMSDNSIKLDRVYNVKSFFAVYDLINKKVIPPDSHVVILHTGGLQGGVV